MQVLHPVCCGIDGQAAQLMACLHRVGEDGTIQTAWGDLGTTSDQLLALRRALMTEHTGNAFAAYSVLQSAGDGHALAVPAWRTG